MKNCWLMASALLLAGGAVYGGEDAGAAPAAAKPAEAAAVKPAAPAAVKPAAPAEGDPAELTLRLLNLEKVYQLSLDQQIATQLQIEPRLQAYAGKIREFCQKYMSFPALKPQILQAYREAFTPEELREINNFIATPTGRKWVERYPQLLKKMEQISQDAAAAHADELKKAMGQEAAAEKTGE